MCTRSTSPSILNACNCETASSLKEARAGIEAHIIGLIVSAPINGKLRGVVHHYRAARAYTGIVTVAWPVAVMVGIGTSGWGKFLVLPIMAVAFMMTRRASNHVTATWTCIGQDRRLGMAPEEAIIMSAEEMVDDVIARDQDVADYCVV